MITNAESTRNIVTRNEADELSKIWKEPLPMNLRKAIQYFSEIESRCDDAIQEQDNLIRQITRRLPEDAIEAPGVDEYIPLTISKDVRTSLKGSDLPFDEFREVALLANKVIKNQMPMATKRFMSQAGRQEVDRIEDLEVDISSLRQQMRDVELQILNHTPRTAEEVARKLKFMTALMLDGGEIEVDFFAYLVEEAADVLEGDLDFFRIL